MSTLTEENYLKTIFKLSNELHAKAVSTNAIAKELNTKAASVTDMLKKLAEKKWINYEKYRGVSLTKEGKKIAVNIIRRHRLWEYFLVDKLKLSWDAVHDIAEELEHIHSDSLIEQLDAYLGFPKYDPHGDPIPDKQGNMITHSICLNDLKEGKEGTIIGIKEHSPEFLQYLEEMDLVLNARIKVLKHFDFDGSLSIVLNKKTKLSLSKKVCQNLYIKT